VALKLARSIGVWLYMGNGDGIFSRWPLVRQVENGDAWGLGESARSPRTQTLSARTSHADRVEKSICPYCAVGCGQLVHVKNEIIIDIEGDPDSTISHGCLCPKGAATFQMVTGSHRVQQVLYRRPHGTAWEMIPLDKALEMVAERVKKSAKRVFWSPGGSNRCARADA